MARQRPRNIPPLRPQPHQRLAFVAALGCALMVVLFLYGHPHWGGHRQEVPLSTAVADIHAGHVRNAVIDDGARDLAVELNNGTTVHSAYPELYGTQLVQTLERAGVPYRVTTPSSGPPWGVYALIALLVAGAGAAFFIARKRVGRLSALPTSMRSTPVEVPTTRFTDIAGLDETVAELTEVVSFLHDPTPFLDAGARIPRGVLLVGPPGVGKTLIARAVAGESGVPFFALSGSDFVETFVGVGAARVRSVFAKARKLGKAIIFIDELDAVGKRRGAGPSHGGIDERENTLNQLLVEMDGFHGSGVMVLGATNRGDVLDPALLRPGRFDRRVSVPAPDRRAREQILALYTRTRTFDADIDLGALARRTAGFSGADLEYLLNEAALEQVRSGGAQITQDNIDTALATVVIGKARRSAVPTERDRVITAWHEGGHALVALVQEHAEDPVHVTIVPHGDAGGVTWMSGSDNQFRTVAECKARLAVALGGRAGEELLLGNDYTQGAANDIEAATALAHDMVTRYGMSALGCVALADSAGPARDDVLGEVRRLMDEALDRARQLAAQHRPALEALVAALLEEESLSREDVALIVAAADDGVSGPGATLVPGA